MKRFLIFALLLSVAVSAKQLQYNTEFENLTDDDTIDVDLHLHNPLDSIKNLINGQLGSDNIADTAKIKQRVIDSLYYAASDWIDAYTRKWQRWSSGTWYGRFGRGAYLYINDTTANDGDFRVYVDSTKLVFLVNDDSTWARHLTADTAHVDSLHVGSAGFACDGAISGTTVNTGQGANELYAMNQDVETSDPVTFATVNTGQGANELYAMNQDVETTDDVTFDSLYVTDIEIGNAFSADSIYTTNGVETNGPISTTGAASITSANDVIATDNIYTVQYNDMPIDGVGWSSYTTNLRNYQKVGRMVYVNLNISGTSNSTSTKVLMPYGVPSSSRLRFPIYAVDDGTVSIGHAYMDETNDSLVCYPSAASSVWTGTGTKSVWANFFFYTTD